MDLYYLMDLSKSMEDDKEAIASLGNSLGEFSEKNEETFKETIFVHR